MNYNTDNVDDMTLALLHLVMLDDKYGTRVWKGFDWGTMNRLHEKGKGWCLIHHVFQNIPEIMV